MSKVILELDDAAEAEFYDIIEYYKQFDRALAYDFIEEYDNAVKRILKFPNAGHPYLHGTKRIFLNRFPYSIVYKVYKDEIIIVFAIVHMKRKPDYWKKRLK